MPGYFSLFVRWFFLQRNCGAQFARTEKKNLSRKNDIDSSFQNVFFWRIVFSKTCPRLSEGRLSVPRNYWFNHYLFIVRYNRISNGGLLHLILCWMHTPQSTRPLLWAKSCQAKRGKNEAKTFRVVLRFRNRSIYRPIRYYPSIVFEGRSMGGCCHQLCSTDFIYFIIHGTVRNNLGICW